MNSKKNSFKRVAAGALAVLTVAAYTTPVANVGGLPSVNILTADAATGDKTSVDLTNIGGTYASNFITSISDGKTTLYSDSLASTKPTSIELLSENTATVKTTVPMIVYTGEATAINPDFGYNEELGKYYDKSAKYSAAGTADWTNTRAIGTYEAGKTFFTLRTTQGINVDVEEAIRAFATTNQLNGAEDEYLLNVDSRNKVTFATSLDKANYGLKVGSGTISKIAKVAATKDERDKACESLALEGGNYYLYTTEKAVKEGSIVQGDLSDDDYAAVISASSLLGTYYYRGIGGATVSGTASNGYTYTFKVPAKGTTVKLKALESKVEITNGTGANVNWGPDSVEDKYAGTDAEATFTEAVLARDNIKLTKETIATNTVDAYQNEVIKLYAEHYFKAYYWNGVRTGSTSSVKTATANYVDGKWVVEIKAFEAADTKILLETAEPTYNYKKPDASTLKVSGNGIDAVAAAITATAYPGTLKDGAYTYPTENEANDKKYALKTGASTQKYRTQVTVDFSKVAEFTNAKNKKDQYSTLKITRNGVEIDDDKFDDDFFKVVGKTEDTDVEAYESDKEITEDASTEPRKYVFTGSGKYVITYTVYVNVNDVPTAKTLTFEFEIATKAKLTAKNVALTFTSPIELKNSEWNGANNAYELTVRGDSSIAVELLKADTLNKKTVTVDAVIYDGNITVKNNEVTPADGVNLLADTKYNVTGSKKVSSVNSAQTLTVTYNDPEYSAGDEDINISWKVVPHAKEAMLVTPESYAWADDEEDYITINEYGYNPEVVTSVDEIGKLSDKLAAEYILVNGDESKISYEYVAGAGAVFTVDELDNHTKGLPSAEGDYSVYVLYDGTTVGIIDVRISKHILYAKPTSKQLNITYGDKFMSDETLKFVGADGKAVSGAKVTGTGFNVVKIKEVTSSNKKKVLQAYLDAGLAIEFNEGSGMYFVMAEGYNEGFFFKNGDKYYIVDTTEYYDEEEEEWYTRPTYSGVYDATSPLPAGDYWIQIGKAETTNVGKTGYGLGTSYGFLNIAKKQITEDMILITPQVYTGSTIDIYKAENALTVVDIDTIKNYGKDVDPDTGKVGAKIASGTTSGKAIGGYQVNVAVDDEEENYTGTVKCKWYIVREAVDEDTSDIEWDDTATTISDNGSIYVTFKRAADWNGKVTHYGVICEKFGKLDAPDFSNLAGETPTERYMTAKSKGSTFYAATSKDKAVQAAYDSLVYGGSVFYQDQTAAMIKKIGNAEKFGMKINVSSVDVGAWARPYVIVEDDEGNESLYYGEVRYVDLVNEVTDQLNLTAAPKALANADGMEVANTKDEAKSKASDAQIKNKSYRDNILSGYRADTAQYYVYGCYYLDPESNMKEDAIQRFGLIIDKNGVVDAYDYDAAENGEDAVKEAYAEVMDKATKTLKLGAKKGFIEGKADKNNAKMDRDEFGAVINPANAVTGVWIREYVDFGNNLVVYTDPVFIKSVSDQYDGYKPYVKSIDPDDADSDTSNKRVITVEAEEIYSDADAKINSADLQKVGVIVSNTEVLYKKDENGKRTDDLVDDINNKFTLENVDTYKFVTGSAKKDEYVSKVTPGEDSRYNPIPLVIRPYAVYKINGKTVTIYGDPEIDAPDPEIGG